MDAVMSVKDKIRNQSLKFAKICLEFSKDYPALMECVAEKNRELKSPAKAAHFLRRIIGNLNIYFHPAEAAAQAK